MTHRAAYVQAGIVTAQVPDFLNACIAGELATDVVKDEHWFQHDFSPTVAGRGKNHALRSILHRLNMASANFCC